MPVCLETLAGIGFDLPANKGIRLDLDDRPQKSPRACVIASDPPAVVHLITRAQGGLHDYQAFLHEAGHALHYAGLDPELPYTFRRLSRDHALTEIYSFLLESITREPGWHALHLGASEEEAAERAEAARFLEVLLFRRYAAKLAYELKFWGDFENANDYAQTYEDNLRAAVGFHYRADGYLADMDGDFYSADYLRAWIRTAQLRAHLRGTHRRGLVAAARDRRAPAGALRRGHAPDERGDRRPDRLRPARHGAARRGAGRGLARVWRNVAARRAATVVPKQDAGAFVADGYGRD